MDSPQQTTTSPRFTELTSPPLADRRRSQRIHEPFAAEICQWLGDRAGASFGVLVQDLSTTGVGIVHTGRLQIGSKYLLEIPRPHQRPLGTIFTVLRCDKSAGGLFHVQLEPDEVLDVAVRAAMRNKRIQPRRRRALLAYVMLAAAAAMLLLMRFSL